MQEIPSYHEEIELTIDTLTNLGLGLGRFNNWVVMVPYTLPKERVRARIYKNYKNYSQADLLEILEASPERTEPLCKLFGTCGGCQYQHLNYLAQLKYKQQQIEEIFWHLAKIKVQVNPTIASPKIFNYRSKLTPHFDKPKPEKPFNIGFLKQGTRHSLIDVPSCPIATENINQTLTPLRKQIQERANSLKKGGTLLLRDTGLSVSTNPKDIVTQKAKQMSFRFVAGEFFQNNPSILPEFVEYVLTQARSSNVSFLVDAYCGVGLFAIEASPYFQKCIGVEINENAINLAQENVQINALNNCEFAKGKAESIFEQISFKGSDTVLLIDPPRKGCDASFLNQVLRFLPRSIIYVSCAPDTQARDITILSKHYNIQAVQPFDFFPHTRHIENVVTLTRKV